MVEKGLFSDDSDAYDPSSRDLLKGKGEYPFFYHLFDAQSELLNYCTGKFEKLEMIGSMKIHIFHEDN